MYIRARHSKRMGALRLSLALFLFLLLLSSPVRAQWWSLIWANPKTSTRSSPPAIPPSITSPSIASLGPSDTPATTEWVVKEDGVTENALEHSTQAEGSVLAPTPSPGVSNFGHSAAESETLPPEGNTGGGSKARSQYKPLKHWKSGECYSVTKSVTIKKQRGRQVRKKRHNLCSRNVISPGLGSDWIRLFCNNKIT